MTDNQKEFALYKATDIFSKLTYKDDSHQIIGDMTALTLDTFLDMAYNKGLEAAETVIMSEFEKSDTKTPQIKYDIYNKIHNEEHI